MKISSVSKKVLCGALSAAMVVAFAPTVAFAKNTDAPAGPTETTATVAVTFDANGGDFVKGSSMTALATETAKVYTKVVDEVTKYYIQLSNDGDDALAVNTDAVEKLGANPSAWFVDADKDGEYNEATELAVDYNKDTPANSHTWLEIDSTTTEVTLKAFYDTASIVAGQGVPFTVNGEATLGSFKVDGLQKDAFYLGTLTDPAGKVIASSGAKQCGNAAADAWDALTRVASVWDDNYKLAKGDYIFSITKVGESAPVLSKTYTVVELTFDAGKYGSFVSDFKNSYLIDKKGTLTDNQLGNTHSTSFSKDNLSTDDGYTFNYWEANGAEVTHETEFKADTTLVATYNNPRVSALGFKNNATTFAQGKGTLQITAASLTEVAAGNAEGVHYQVTVSGPNGFSKTIVKKNDGNKIDKDSINDLELTFGADYEGYQAVTTPLAAGTYTVSVAAVADEGYLLSEAQKKAVATKSIELAAVSYDLGAADWKNATVKAAVAKTQKTLAVVGTKVSDIAATLAAELTAENIKPTDSLQGIDYVTFNGVKAADLKETKVTSEGVKVAVVYKEAKAALPEVTFAASGDKYVATIVPAAGTTVRADGKVIGSDGKVTLAANGKLPLTVTAGSKTNAITYYGCGLATNPGSVAAGIAAWATDVANSTTSVSTANAPVRYGTTLTTLKADAVAALQATGFVADVKGAGTAAGAWAKEVAAQKKAILEKIAAVEIANIEAAKALVKGADGKYTYVSESEAAKAIDAVNKVVADFEGLTAKQAGDIKDYIATSSYDGNPTHLVEYNSDGDRYAAAMKIAATCASIKVEAAVAEPVIAVNEQLKAAKTGAEAQAAIEAYNKLTAEQKAMVASADVAAAEELAAAQELKDAQDETAVAKARNASKTVKAGKNGKTTKKQSVTLKKITSKSGAKVTYKKSSGSSKVTVKSGKAYLAKGVKKGTYKATVKATCGTQTAKIKVTFKVK